MRVVREVQSEDYKVTVFHWNNKYLIKFEDGNIEQTYKASALDFTSDFELLQLLEDEDFMRSVNEHFESMSKSLGKALRKIM
ncbi:MAG: hypothetical protein JJU28_23155 [Cyclobacteriaceae bacterium]|nr:hypothetical protein [Cyclobacteriaceae bacterium]